jgi:hypothetical protein
MPSLSNAWIPPFVNLCDKCNDENGYKKCKDQMTNFGKWDQLVSYDGAKIIAFLEGLEFSPRFWC